MIACHTVFNNIINIFKIYQFPENIKSLLSQAHHYNEAVPALLIGMPDFLSVSLTLHFKIQINNHVIWFFGSDMLLIPPWRFF